MYWNFHLVKIQLKENFSYSRTTLECINVMEMKHINWICMKWKLPHTETEMKPTISQVLLFFYFFFPSVVITMDIFFPFKKPATLLGDPKWKHAYLLIWIVKLKLGLLIYFLLCLSGDWICMYTEGSTSLNFSGKLQLSLWCNRIKELYCIWHEICVQNYWSYALNDIFTWIQR